jgi:hypothetical protein
MVAEFTFIVEAIIFYVECWTVMSLNDPTNRDSGENNGLHVNVLNISGNLGNYIPDLKQAIREQHLRESPYG